jgi:hypothetical protein
MSKYQIYRDALSALPEESWEASLLAESGLPGPRGNLELAQAVAEMGSRDFFLHCLEENGPLEAPVNDPREFLAFCGALGLGRLIAAGQDDLLEVLRLCANDSRWRMHEAVAMALQEIGRVDFGRMLEIASGWSRGSWLEKRAAIAGLAEPSLLTQPKFQQDVLDLFDDVTASLDSVTDRCQADCRVLRQGLGYAWSVVVAAWPEQGIRRMDRWLHSDDRDVRWVMRQNLLKKRLARAAPDWTSAWLARFTQPNQSKIK